MKPIDIINKFYDIGSKPGSILLKHSEAVTEKALRLAEKVSHLKPDIRFIEEAAMLHDIGIFYTNSPSIGCSGDYPYVCHGYLGRKLMEDMGYDRHALVCERHVGAGLSVDEIKQHGLPLPSRNMVPVSIEEQIICYADKFFSKKPGENHAELPLDAVIRKIEGYGVDQSLRFKLWVDLFETNGWHEKG